MITIEVKPCEEVVETATKVIQKRGIISGSLTLIGGVDSCCISNMDKADATKDILTEYNEPLEMTAVGEIIDGKPHIHATFGREDNSALFGHLHWAKVKTWFVHVYITPLANSKQ